MPKSKITLKTGENYETKPMYPATSIVKILKYQCWKCEGSGKIQTICHGKYGGIHHIDYKPEDDCFVCNGKGYIELIPYNEKHAII